jgi:hypothetical protein
MVAATETFSQWLDQAQLSEHRLTPQQHALLRAAFHFLQRQGSDYYSTRLLSHFLLHCGCGLKVAQIARLLGLCRTTASRQQGLSSKETVQQAHHRLDGRPYGKLLPRYAGPIAQFVLTHPQASRYDILDFIDQTFGIRVSRVALYHFLKKFGLDQVPGTTTAPTAAAAQSASTRPMASRASAAPRPGPGLPASESRTALPATPGPSPGTPVGTVADAGRPVPLPAPPLCTHAPSTPVPSC